MTMTMTMTTTIHTLQSRAAVRSRRCALSVAALVGALAVAADAGSAPPARAESPAHADQARADKAQAEVAAAMALFDAKNYAGAEQGLEQAYRTAPLPEILYHLGRVAQAAGKAAAAADYYRRYLDLVGGQVDVATRAAIDKQLTDAAAVLEQASEVAVSGESGARLLIDDRVIGMLPLPGAVLLPAGAHRFALEKAGKRTETDSLTLPERRAADVRLTPGSRGVLLAVISLPQPVVLGLEAPEAVATVAVPAIERAIKQERSVLVPRDKVAARLAREPAGCLTRPACQESVAQREGGQAVLTLRAVPEGGGLQLSGSLFDVGAGDVAARAEESCAGCDGPRAAAKLAELTARLLQESASKPRGRLEISSTPPGAAVSVDGRAVGVTPYQREAFTGAHAVALTRTGFTPYQGEATVEPGQTATVTATLEQAAGPEPAPVALTQPPPPGRPKARLIAGGVTLGAGVILGAFGASALYARGRCDGFVDAESCQRYETGIVGGALLGVGAALAVTGVVLLALPGERAKQVRVALAPQRGGAWLSLGRAF